jgi:hypothetical protein
MVPLGQKDYSNGVGTAMEKKQAEVKVEAREKGRKGDGSLLPLEILLPLRFFSKRTVPFSLFKENRPLFS